MSVAAMLARLRSAPSPLEALMGEEWAKIAPGRGGLARLEALLAQGARREARRRTPSGLALAAGGRAAMVNLIGKGGASDRAGLARQMAYLSRQGETPLRHSERYFGAPIEAGDFDAFADAWGLRGSAEGADRTTHFLVSFPPGTEHAAAERAGRAWAEAMFASGRFGDVWDYYTAFHTDRAHPHTHVVVNRRGLEAGEWLKVSWRSAMHWDVLREVQVEVAREEGIHLEATPRHARGVLDRPTPDAEIRHAAREGRAPVAPAHTPDTAIAAAVSALQFSRRFTADAALARPVRSDIAEALEALAHRVASGALVKPARPALTQEEAHAMAETIATQRDEVLREFQRLDREIAATHPADRPRYERQTAVLKAETARVMPDSPELARFAPVDDSGHWRGLPVPETQEARRIGEHADRRAAAAAERYGVDGETAAARYAGDEPVPRRLAEQWAADERATIAQAAQGRAPLSTEDVETMRRSMHAEIGAGYEAARREIAALERGRESGRGRGRDDDGHGL